MRAILLIHILTGSLGLISGFVALYVSKGARLHRRAGMVFVAVMLTMAATGTVIAAVRGAAPALNIPAAVMTAYLVVTGLTTVRPPAAARSIAIAGMSIAFAVGTVMLVFGIQAIAAGGKRFGMPAFPFFLFGVIGVLGSIGDLRALRSGVARGAPRLARHLWRMCTALLIASMSFFIGQAKVIPKPIRIMPLLALPILAVLVTMLYWVWRIRNRRSTRGVVTGAATEVA